MWRGIQDTRPVLHLILDRLQSVHLRKSFPFTTADPVQQLSATINAKRIPLVRAISAIYFSLYFLHVIWFL